MRAVPVVRDRSDAGAVPLIISASEAMPVRAPPIASVPSSPELHPRTHPRPLTRLLPRVTTSPLDARWAASLAADVVPAAAACGASASAAFVVTARAARAAAYAAGVSCATPVLGAAWGVASVGAASALAGQCASLALGARTVDDLRASFLRAATSLRGGGVPRRGGPAGASDPVAREATEDAILGAVLYAAASRPSGLRTALPSDVSHPGALARRSMPSNGAHYATDAQRKTLALWMRRDGCHHCGATRGPVVGDHMPPNKKAFGSGAAAARAREGRWTTRAWNFLRMVPKQRFYPQCRPCSDLQSVAVRTGRKTLVTHRGGLVAGMVVAGAVGARHYVMVRHPKRYAEMVEALERVRPLRWKTR